MAFSTTVWSVADTRPFDSLKAGAKFRFAYPAVGKQPFMLSVDAFVKGDGDQFRAFGQSTWRSMSDTFRPRTTLVVLR